MVPTECPLVSTIIPVFDGERFLAEALDSVLGQDYGPMEVIVVDDGSTDGSSEVARRYLPDIRLIQQSNRGGAAARNRGVTDARGEMLAFLDADDVWEPGKLSVQTAVLAREPDLEAVLGQIREFREANGVVDSEAHIGSDPAIHDSFHTDTLLIRRQAFDRIGPFNPEWQIEIVEWFVRSRELRLRAQVLPQVLAWRRIHGQNLGIRERDRARTEYVRLLKQMLDRRRGSDA